MHRQGRHPDIGGRNTGLGRRNRPNRAATGQVGAHNERLHVHAGALCYQAQSGGALTIGGVARNWDGLRARYPRKASKIVRAIFDSPKRWGRLPSVRPSTWGLAHPR